MLCMHCGSSSRNRHVAMVVLQQVLGERKNLAPGIAKLSEVPTFKMLNTDPDGAMARTLGASMRYFCSGFYPDIRSGKELRPYVYCQDLSRLSFDEGIFDIVVTEDVLEHVREHDKAFSEIHRVLKPGGCHVFTIPFFFDRTTLHRVDVREDQDVELLPAEYHYDSLRGEILSYRTFGVDLYESLASIGFETDVHFSRYCDRHFGIYDSVVFTSRKKRG
jgi:SAM-dependent methyltransferase